MISKKEYIFLLLVSLVIIVLWVAMFKKVQESYSDDVPTVSFPFKNFYDEKGKKLNIILISAPFRETRHEQLYEDYKKKGLAFCGISSYINFPNEITNPYDSFFHRDRKHDYIKMVSTWLTCFREQSEGIKSLPHMLMTEADLKDIFAYQPNSGVTEKLYDTMIVCLKDNDKCEPGWNWYNRNWDLTQKILDKICEKDIRILIVGRSNCTFSSKCNAKITHKELMPFHEFAGTMKQCKTLLVPNIYDASPRIITEAMCYNIPVMVNEQILGGWHNVIPDVTGEFFVDEDSAVKAYEKVMANYTKYTPRDWYVSHRGKEISGAELAKFLVKHYPNLNNKTPKYVTVTI